MLPLHQPAREVAVWIKKQIKLEENFVMGRTLKTVITGMGVILTALVPYSLAQAPTLQEQLAAQYKIVRMGSDTSGYSVVEKGTLLAIQKGGILAVPYADQAVPPSKYEGGSIHGPSSVSLMGRKSIMGRFGKEQTTHLFQVGDKVYPMKIDVNVAKDTVSMSVVACDTCNKTDPPTYNKAQVVFQFPKGSLVKASAGEVEDIIGQVLSISEEEQQQGGDQGGQQQGGDQGQQGGGNQQPQPQAEPQSIEKGMTTDQVEGAMGKPEKIVNLGPKKIYVYKDLKVTFLNGKVFDVQ
jgi:hypothetical protein